VKSGLDHIDSCGGKSLHIGGLSVVVRDQRRDLFDARYTRSRYMANLAMIAQHHCTPGSCEHGALDLHFFEMRVSKASGSMDPSAAEIRTIGVDLA